MEPQAVRCYDHCYNHVTGCQRPSPEGRFAVMARGADQIVDVIGDGLEHVGFLGTRFAGSLGDQLERVRRAGFFINLAERPRPQLALQPE